MKTEAKIILDSVSPAGARLTTMQLVYPRFIHSEFMTHRVFSRNAMSSRAVPVKKMIEQVQNSPAMPCHWGANQPGMQARSELTGRDLEEAKALWLKAARDASDHAERMMEIGLHKQVANRILEPFQFMHTIVTATEWDNFFSLRIHPDADPNIYELAVAMKAAMDGSEPVERYIHRPYMRDGELPDFFGYISAARCARVSFLNHDGSEPDFEKDLALAIMLKDSRHASPFEHQATCMGVDVNEWDANFMGWKQFRSTLGI